MSTIRSWLVKALPFITGACLLVQLLSLRLGLLNAFFYDAAHADVQGIDYFSLPKAFLNLAAGRSAYATYDPPLYGPHSTSYAAHPALVVWMGSWLSLFAPMTSYGIYTVLAVGMMAACAWLIARESSDALTRRLAWLLIMAAFPTYLMLYVGNVHALTVLALAMLLVGVYRLTSSRRGEALILAGLLLSLFSKPVVLLMMPLLLMLKETRRAAVRALVIYAVVSAVFEVVPALNPEPIGLKQVAWLAVHPAFVRENMNLYTNRFQVNVWMRDNSAHWFYVIAQSSARLMHIDIYSLPVFLDTLTGTRTPDWVFRLPLLLTLVLSVLAARIADARLRMEAALLALMATSLVFFLGYPTAWEYQYTSVLPLAAMLLVVGERGVFYSRSRWWMFALAACAWLPSLYIFTDGRPATPAVLVTIWMDRAIPVTLLFFLMTAELIHAVWMGRRINQADAP